MQFLRIALATALALGASTAQNAAVQRPIIANPPKQTSSNVLLFVGTYTRDEGWVNGTGKGVYAFKFNKQTGQLTEVGATKFGENPTFITGTRGKGRRVLYATSEVNPGFVHAISVDKAGVMTELNKVDSGGAGSTHVSVSPNQDFLTVSNYGGGSVSMFPINADGSLKPSTFNKVYPKEDASKVKPPQEAPHLHSMTWVPKTSTVLGCDLGSDRVVQFTLDAASQTLTEAGVIMRPPGSGPRHMALHPTNKFAYVLDELSSTIGVYAIEATGLLTPTAIQDNVSTLPDGAGDGWTAADIHVSRDGRFLYSSNRHGDVDGSIAIFSVDAATGKIAPIGHESTKGKIPRSFSLYGNFLLVANQKTDTIEVFNVDGATGLLSFVQSTKCNTPVRLFFPQGW